MQEAECERLRMDAKYVADTKIADSKRQFQMQKAAFDMEVNAKVRLLFCRLAASCVWTIFIQ